MILRPLLFLAAASLPATALGRAATGAAQLPRPILDRTDPESRAVNCAAYLGHEINAVPRAARPPLIATMRAWRADLERERSKDEADQYFASTFAVLRDTPAPIRRVAAAYCRAHAPRR